MHTSNWPHGTDLGHPNFTGRIPRVSKYDGQGGFAPGSSKIPLLDAVLYVGGTALTIWAAVRVAFWIWG